MKITNLIAPVLGLAVVTGCLVYAASAAKTKNTGRYVDRAAKDYKTWLDEKKEEERIDEEIKREADVWDGTHIDCPYPDTRIPRNWDLSSGPDRSPLSIINKLYERGCPGPCCPHHGRQIDYHLNGVGKDRNSGSYDYVPATNRSAVYPFWYRGSGWGTFECKGDCKVHKDQRDRLRREKEEKRKKAEELKRWRKRGHYDFCKPPTCSCGLTR